MSYRLRALLGTVIASATFVLPVPGTAGGDAAEAQLLHAAPVAHGIASGRIADVAGKPIVGARIVAYAWPTQEEMSRLGVGDEFDLIPVAAVRSGSDGSYALQGDFTGLKDRVGHVNIDVLVDSAQGSAAHALSVDVEARAIAITGSRSVAGGADPQSVTRSIDLTLTSAPLAASKMYADQSGARARSRLPT